MMSDMFGTKILAIAPSGLLVINDNLDRAMPYPVAFALSGHL
jgi:hypothetical protein